MRDWGLPPKIFCCRHLGGNFKEIIYAAGNLAKSGKYAKSLTKAGYLEPQNFRKRHRELVVEATCRGYNYKAKLPVRFPIIHGHVDRTKSISDLITRCPMCAFRFLQWMRM